jgi:hypothetical protein
MAHPYIYTYIHTCLEIKVINMQCSNIILNFFFSMNTKLLSIYGSTVLFVGPWPLFQFLNLYTASVV